MAPFIAIDFFGKSLRKAKNATVQWSNERQEWELADTFAKPAHCQLA